MPGNKSTSVPEKKSEQNAGKSKGVQDLYDDHAQDPQDTAPESDDPQEEKSFGDKVHDYASDEYQDYRDANTVSDGKFGDGVKNTANNLKDRYFPGKEANEDKEDGDQKNEDNPAENNQDRDDQNPADTADREEQNQDNQTEGSQKQDQSKGSSNSGQATQAGKSGADQAANNADQAKTAGQTADTANSAADSAQKAGSAIDTGAKVADTADKTAQAADAAVKGAEVAAEAGEIAAEAGAGAATGGVALAAVEGAKAAYRAAKAAAKLIKEGLKLKDRVEAGGRLLKKYWWCGCIGFIPVIIVIGTVYFLYSKVLHLDTLSRVGQAIVSVFHRNSANGKLTFTNPDSMKAIQDGEISETAARIITSISNDKPTTINFVGISPITGSENQPFEFDVLSYDTIKCTLGNEKLEEIKVDFQINFDWASKVVAGKESARCALDYFPTIEPPVATRYSAYGPGEFNLSEIAIAGPKAAVQKTAELIDVVSQKNASAVTAYEDLPLNKLYINKEIYQMISSEVINSITGNFQDRPTDEIIVKKSGANGIHFDFGIEVQKIGD